MRLRAAALSLTICLSAAGLAWADDTPSGNWLSNLFSRPAAKNADKDTEEKDEPPRTSPTNLLKKLEADLDRRQEVCMRLKGVALELGDEELMRKADELDQRAWQTYLAGKNRIGIPERGESAAKKSTNSSSKGDRE